MSQQAEKKTKRKSKVFGKLKSSKKSQEGSSVKLAFGVPLDPDSVDIPPVVEKCVEWLFSHGTDVEGIFRLSPNHTALEELAAKFDSGEDVDLESPLALNSNIGNNSTLIDAHTVAGLLKKWFRELPEPLCTLEMYDMWMAAVSIKDKPTLLAQVKKIISFLPPANRKLIQYLATFLKFLAKFSSVTKMTSANLSICFAPNLLRAPDTIGLADQIEESPMANALLQTFIEDYEYIFGNDVPKVPEPAAQTVIPNSPKTENIPPASQKNGPAPIPPAKKTPLAEPRGLKVAFGPKKSGPPPPGRPQATEITDNSSESDRGIRSGAPVPPKKPATVKLAFNPNGGKRASMQFNPLQAMGWAPGKGPRTSLPPGSIGPVSDIESNSADPQQQSSPRNASSVEPQVPPKPANIGKLTSSVPPLPYPKPQKTNSGTLARSSSGLAQSSSSSSVHSLSDSSQTTATNETKDANSQDKLNDNVPTQVVESTVKKPPTRPVGPPPTDLFTSKAQN